MKRFCTVVVHGGAARTRRHVIVGLACMVSVLVALPATAAGGWGATHVLGQSGSFTIGNCNGSDNATITADTLCAPSGVATDNAGNVYVADYYNNRVLEFDTPFARGGNTSADRVFGQPDFTSVYCNSGGVTASTMCGPWGITLDSSGDLFVSEYQNHRVLEYNTPLAPGSDTVADHVFGQSDAFATNSCNEGGNLNADTLCNPEGVAVDAGGNVYVADTSNSRVVEYDTPLASGGNTTADRVFGQPSLTDVSCNLGNPSAPTADSLCQPVGVAVDGSGDLYVGDYANSRVLEYNTPLATGADAAADQVFGQGGSFTTGNCGGGGFNTPSATTLCNPQGVAVDAHGNLYVADFGNNRVLFYRSPLRDARADKVYGQSGSYATSYSNGPTGIPNAATLEGPVAVAVNSRFVVVADFYNSRVLGY